MTRSNRVFSFTFLLLVLSAMLTGCGMSEADRKSAESIPEQIKAGTAYVQTKKGSFASSQKSAAWAFLKPYGEREKWQEGFVDAEKEISHANQVYANNIAPLLKKDDSKDVGRLAVEVKRATGALQSARNSANKPEQRASFLLKARAEAPQWVNKAQSETADTSALLASTRMRTEKAKLDYPEKTSDINNRFAGVQKIAQDGALSLQQAETELKSSDTNYANLGDATKNVSVKLEAMKAEAAKTVSKLDELYRSYEKTLVDMKIEYFVAIGRTSWDEASDWPSENDYVYTKPVDEKVYGYFDALADGTEVATYQRGWSGSSTTPRVDRTMFDALNLNVEENWPSRSDDSAEFWVSDTTAKTYHKYLITENGKRTETEWEAVSEDSYWKHEEDLGMSLVTKPYGMYESEALTSATPPGFAYVGNPKYGRWENDPQTGERHWSFLEQYAMYHLLFGGNNYYHYSDWNSWDRRSPYYGRDEQYGTSGAATYNGNSRYSRTSYAERNPGTVRGARTAETTTGGSKAARSSVRDAGPIGRGRGPGGGGK